MYPDPDQFQNLIDWSSVEGLESIIPQNLVQIRQYEWMNDVFINVW